MRIAVIITCHNYGDLVADAIRSVFEQGYADRRIVVVDDASQDDSWEVIQGMVKGGDCPLEAFRTDQPMGQSWCKNFGMQAVWDQSDGFAFLDADDFYLPGKLDMSADLLKSTYGSVGLVYSDDIVEDRVLGYTRHRFRPPFSLGGLIAGDCVGGNYAISKALVQNVKGFDEAMKVAEDYDLARRAVEKHVLLHIPCPLVHTRLTPRSLTYAAGAADWAHFRGMVSLKAEQRNGKSTP